MLENTMTWICSFTLWIRLKTLVVSFLPTLDSPTKPFYWSGWCTKCELNLLWLSGCIITRCLMYSSFFSPLNNNPWHQATIRHRRQQPVTTCQHMVCFSMATERQTIRRCRCRVWRRCEWWDPIPGWFVELAEEIIAFIWNGHSAFIWVNGAEGDIFCRGLTLCQHIEEGWLPENKNTSELHPSKVIWIESDGSTVCSIFTRLDNVTLAYVIVSLFFQKN